ncbi:hypothetical protein CC85DRAFT_35168 [Cutaneotrichosporon oleaginosum]|uniref:Uncharacterized protein n=1 Tax=Cutaneotrichosporon oleaginosum TaxID=879819 RepID=A0A0J0XS86_9TREE|nr:uncharacterized protein CC85DRAFT_35168 [Cutaneotrichosporon oleaginosum]KLT43930.1 hypothetical protein CC85DRAFT_35168 [Cutaneotrichosporon oleaginosum]TXT04123.1 hypothetical protein COLE_07820 [Cutaneotrichosporon oleaginosum]
MQIVVVEVSTEAQASGDPAIGARPTTEAATSQEDSMRASCHLQHHDSTMVTNNKAAMDTNEAIAVDTSESGPEHPRQRLVVAVILVATGILSGLGSAFAYGVLLTRGE